MDPALIRYRVSIKRNSLFSYDWPRSIACNFRNMCPILVKPTWIERALRTLYLRWWMPLSTGQWRWIPPHSGRWSGFLPPPISMDAMPICHETGGGARVRAARVRPGRQCMFCMFFPCSKAVSLFLSGANLLPQPLHLPLPASFCDNLRKYSPQIDRVSNRDAIILLQVDSSSRESIMQVVRVHEPSEFQRVC